MMAGGSVDTVGPEKYHRFYWLRGRATDHNQLSIEH
jgi:hypothetical protein